ncbi:MAG: class I SAM-dependent methyltransferase [Clostridium sp.]|nr:class I SAM-dependent methyltransferase [Clostridium sp.]
MEAKNLKNTKNLKELWKQEEAQAHIQGWDFSHIEKRYDEENDLPWDYKAVVQAYLKPELNLLDIDTGGGEFLLSLRHPCHCTAATEGYPPNVELCRKTLLPLGINFREMTDASRMPFEDNQFDVVINRHGSCCISELQRILKKGGLYITEQVGEDNDRELIELLLPGTPKAFPGLNLKKQKALFAEAGFKILKAEECFRPIKFYDVGALVWFARVIEWEFPNFTVENCFERLLEAQRILEKHGVIQGTIHRYLLVVQK